MNKKINFGIIGCGMISKWHANSIMEIEDARLVGVTDTIRASAEKFTQDFPCKIFDSVDDLLTSDEIDVVCICTPSGLHAPLAIKAAKNNKHFVVEKPMSITKKDIDELVSICEKNNIKSAVISQLRFSEGIKKVKKAIDNGELGDIVLADVRMKFFRSKEYFSTASWRGTWAMDGGGALMNQGIHGIDILQYLAGPVKSVSAMCKTLVHDIEVEDTASAVVEYENGAIGIIQGTTSVTPGYPRVIEISGTRGTIALREDEIIKWDVDGKSLIDGENSNKGPGTANDPTAFSHDLHKMQIEDLISAIKEDRRPLVDIYEGKRPVEIILAIYESSKTGKKVNI